MKRTKTIQVLDRAAILLKALSEAEEGLSLSECADCLGVTPQTAQSILRTLEANGYAYQPRKKGPYWLGATIPSIARRWENSGARGALARPEVLALRDRLGEYVVLAELRGTALYALLEARSHDALTVGWVMGQPDRIHTKATGKVLLAYLPEYERDALISRLPWEQLGPRTIMDPEQLKVHLSGVVRQGYAQTSDEIGEGICALAVPVFDRLDGTVPAALGTYLPTVRYSDEKAESLIAKLTATATRISESWGIGNRQLETSM